MSDDAEFLHVARKLLFTFSKEYMRDPWTMSMINSFLIEQGLMTPCHHENAKKVTWESPQGLRHGLKCPDCDASIYFPVGETDGELPA